MNKPQPYKGLQPYQEADEANFFGRTAEKRILIDKILTRKLTLLFAASGVGKSSLLQAAVLPELKRGTAHQVGLHVVYCNDWVKDPSASLKRHIEADLKQQQALNPDHKLDSQQELNQTLQICSLFTSDPLVILLDQFEECFVYHRHQPYLQAFISELARAIHDHDTNTVFVIAMREDFALELNAFKPALPALLFENYYRLERLSREQAELAIIKPLEKIGKSIEPDLLKQLLNDLSRREYSTRKLLDNAPLRVEPPNLQMICNQLWEQDHAKPQLSLSSYQHMGKTQGLSKRYFTEKITRLAKTEHATASKAFDFLISSQGTKMAYPLPDLSQRTGKAQTDLQTTLDKLEAVRILRRQSRPEFDATGQIQDILYYELYHDLFAEPISDWNKLYKQRQRIKHGIVGGTIFAITLTTLTAAYDVIQQKNNQHLRLSFKTGVESPIELWDGSSHAGWDWFGLHDYHQESRYRFQDLEADKLFQHKAVGQRSQLNPELISLLPMKQRLQAYIEAGELDVAESLLNNLRSEDKALAKATVDALAESRTAWGLEILQQAYFQSELYLREYMIKMVGFYSHIQSFAWIKACIQQEENSDVKQTLVAVLPSFISTQYENDSLQQLLIFIKDENSYVRSSSAKALGYFAGTTVTEQAINPLIALLKDEDSDVRSYSAEALSRFAGTIGAAQAIKPLIALLKDEDMNPRSSSIRVLGDFAGTAGIEQAIKPLIALLKDEDSYVRSSSAEALGRFADTTGAKQVIKPLIALLKNENSTVRSYSAEALGSFAGTTGAEQVIKPLIALLKDEDSDVRSASAQALSRFAGTTGVEQAIKLLIALLKDENNTVRSSSARALASFADTTETEQAIKTLVVLLKDEDSSVRYSSARALGRFADIAGAYQAEQAINSLTDLLKDEDIDVRYSSAEALGSFAATTGAEQAIKHLNALLKDKDINFRFSGIRALSRFAGTAETEQAINLLITLLKDENRDVRDYSGYVLGRFAGTAGAEQAINSLIVLLKDEDNTVRSSSAEALGILAATTGTDQAIKPLIFLLKDDSSRVRSFSAQALGNFAGTIGTEQAINPLVALLKDEDNTVRSYSAEALGSFAGTIGTEQAINPLITLLKDENSTVRYYSVEALGSFAGIAGAEQAVKPLITLLKDESLTSSSAKALSSFSGTAGAEQAVKPLIALLRAEESIVHSYSAEALGSFAGTTGAVQVIKPLMTLLKDEDSGVRSSSAEALGSFAGMTGAEQVIKPLIALLKDEDSDVRSSSASALSHFVATIEAAQTISPLIMLLKQEKDLKNRQVIIHTLSLFNQHQSQSEIEQILRIALSDQAVEIRLQAKLGLWLVGQHCVSATSPCQTQTAPVLSAREAVPAWLAQLDLSEAKAILSTYDNDYDDGQNLSKTLLLQTFAKLDPSIPLYIHAWLADQANLDVRLRFRSVQAMGKTGLAQAAPMIVNLAEKYPEQLAHAAYDGLDRLGKNGTAGLDYLEQQLKQQVQFKQDWRKQRQQLAKKDMSEAEQEEEYKKLNEAAVNPHIAGRLAIAISHINPERGLELMQHHLYHVREGAWLGFANAKPTALLAELIEKHQNSDQPLFQYVFYRALDLTLRHLEVNGEQQDLDQLRDLLNREEFKTADIKHHPVVFAMQQRLEWTITELDAQLRYLATLDEEYANRTTD